MMHIVAFATLRGEMVASASRRATLKLLIIRQKCKALDLDRILKVYNTVVKQWHISSIDASMNHLKLISGKNTAPSSYLWDTDLDTKNQEISIIDELNRQAFSLSDCAIKSNCLEIDHQLLQGPELVSIDGIKIFGHPFMRQFCGVGVFELGAAATKSEGY
jgi:hypothetical protein